DQPRCFQKAFIPIMIYDDILESFFYNQEILQRKLKENFPNEGNLSKGDLPALPKTEPQLTEDTKSGEDLNSLENFDVSALSVISFSELENLQIVRSVSKSEIDAFKSIQVEILAIQLSDIIES
ncbi:MAG: hypothetical protein KAR20_00430, partial [Candidatus Heimdallarchaeota archaeon]|nr:hypothetical protein [Candidatus Heimdallarchaeota archaeon]